MGDGYKTAQRRQVIGGLLEVSAGWSAGSAPVNQPYLRPVLAELRRCDARQLAQIEIEFD